MTTSIHSPSSRHAKIAVVLGSLLLATGSFAKGGGGKGMSGGLGAGVAYSARHLALFNNPAALIEGDSKASLYGAYGLGTEDITTSLTATSGMVGFGGGVIYPMAGGDPLYVGGLGFGTGKFNLGFNATSSGGSASFDAGAVIDFSAVRLGVVVRDLTDISQIDVGLGFMVSGPLRLELDWYQRWPMSTKTSLVGGSLLYLANPLSFEFGYTAFLADGNLSNGTVHVALEVALGKSLGLQAEYRPRHDASDYLAGLRLKF